MYSKRWGKYKNKSIYRLKKCLWNWSKIQMKHLHFYLEHHTELSLYLFDILFTENTIHQVCFFLCSNVTFLILLTWWWRLGRYHGNFLLELIRALNQSKGCHHTHIYSMVCNQFQSIHVLANVSIKNSGKFEKLFHFIVWNL